MKIGPVNAFSGVRVDEDEARVRTRIHGRLDGLEVPEQRGVVFIGLLSNGLKRGRDVGRGRRAAPP